MAPGTSPGDADAAFEEIGDLTLVEDKDIEIGLPLIERARVVYTGNHPFKSQPMRGQLIVESWEVEAAILPHPGDPKRKIPPHPGRPAVTESSKVPTMEHGITSYDFSLRDQRGKLLTARRMPPNAHPRVANKPWHLVEHPEHLRLFKRLRDREGRPEFEVMIPMGRRAAFDNYVADKERLIGRHTSLADYAAGLRQTPE